MAAKLRTRHRASRSSFFSVFFVFWCWDVFFILKLNETSIQNQSKINQKSIKHGPNIYQKSSKIEVRRAPVQVWRRLGPSWAIQSVFGGILDCLGSVLEASWRRLGGLLGGLWPRKVANMAPTWPPTRSQNQLKIDLKIDKLFNVPWNRFLERFWWIWDAKMKQSWSQNGIQNRCEIRTAIFQKSVFFLRETMFFEIQ